jgi:hypothetical protein
VVDVNGSQLSVNIMPFTDGSATTASDTTTSGGTVSGAGPTTGSGNSSVWLGGNVTMPADGTTVEAKVRDEASVAVPDPKKVEETAGKENVSQTGQSTASAEKQDARKSVLEQFREFQGEKTPKTLVALFARALEGSRQQPLVALSDGKSSVKASVEVSAGKTSPRFALKGAKLVSLKKSGASTWVVEAVPAKGVFEATITVLQDGATREIPLTVAPPLPAGFKIAGDKLTEADFERFLNGRGTDKAAGFDLNGDGKKDYVDDYIFTANFLAKPGAGKPAVEK